MCLTPATPVSNSRSSQAPLPDTVVRKTTGGRVIWSQYHQPLPPVHLTFERVYHTTYTAPCLVPEEWHPLGRPRPVYCGSTPPTWSTRSHTGRPLTGICFAQEQKCLTAPRLFRRPHQNRQQKSCCCKSCTGTRRGTLRPGTTVKACY